MRRIALALAAFAVLAGTAVAAAPKITAKGVDGVKLGRTYSSLRAAGLIGKIRPGCELAGPKARSAKLRAPLKGSVDFTQSTPRKVATITVTGGAKARGVGIGSTLAAVKHAFPKAKIDHSGESVFGLTFAIVPKSGGGRLMFGIRKSTGKVTVIGIPIIAVCE